MGKESKKEMKKGFPLLTTAQSNAYKEQVNVTSYDILEIRENSISRIWNTNGKIDANEPRP